MAEPREQAEGATTEEQSAAASYPRNSAVLRVHRGPASPDRVVVYGTTPLGPLADEITEFRVSPGHHLVSLKLGFHHSVATWVTLRPGQVLDLVVEDNVQAIAPALQGGFLRFHHD